MDNAATTRVREEAAEMYLRVMRENFGNPSSVHAFGREAARELNAARKTVARVLNAEKDEIFFTSGGSESDNWAVKGIARALAHKGKHIITTAFEHHAILHTCEALEKEGFDVTYLPVSADGLVLVADVANAMREDTVLVSVMAANNEVGSVQPIAEIGALCRDMGVLFHTDAVQAAGHIPLDVKAQNIDLLSLSGHKFYAPKGTGVLYIRRGIVPQNLIDGGEQEKGRRAGTENVPAIAAMAVALQLAAQEMREETERLTALREKLKRGISEICPEAIFNGKAGLPGHLNVTFPGIGGEALLLSLDMAGIAISAGSACTAGSLDPSHVLLAMGVEEDLVKSSVRFSLGKYNTEEDVDRVLEKLPNILQRLRN